MGRNVEIKARSRDFQKQKSGPYTFVSAG